MRAGVGGGGGMRGVLGRWCGGWRGRGLVFEGERRRGEGKVL